MRVLADIDAWVIQEAQRHEDARRKGHMFLASLPGMGFLKFFATFIMLPLIASEAMFIAGLPALPVSIVVLILVGLLAIFYWRYFTHRRLIRSGSTHRDAFR